MHGHQLTGEPKTSRREDLTEVLKYLAGMDYPAPRNKLIAVAREHGAPQRVVDTLHRLPETADFRTRDQVARAIDEIP